MAAPRAMVWSLGALLLAAVSLSLGGCQALISDPGAEVGSGGPDRTPFLTPPPTEEGGVAEAEGLSRLTGAQWENTVRRLLLLAEPTGLADTFIGDTGDSVFRNQATDLIVSSELWSDYQNSAEILAERIVTDDALFAGIAPPAIANADDPATAFVESFLPRAYRRPLTPSEIAAHVAMFNQGEALTDFVGPKAGVYLVVSLALQSPHFIYRSAVGDGAGDGTRALTAYELASRLSYALWDNMPDRALFASAASGAITTEAEYASQVERMLDDEQADGIYERFFDLLLELDQIEISVSPDQFPAYDSALTGDSREETLHFVRYVGLEREGGLQEILGLPETFVNARLANVYGLEGDFDDTFQRVDLDVTRRSGILTQIAALARDSKDGLPDPIHRGKYLIERILCLPIGGVPGDIPPLPEPMPGTTNRQRIESHTGEGTCGQACHAGMLNPAGFALEQFDALGQWREDENGLPIDATGSLTADRDTVSYDGAVEFRDQILAQSWPHECQAENWMQFLLGRATEDADEQTTQELGRRSLEESLSLRDLITSVVSSPAFRFRAMEDE